MAAAGGPRLVVAPPLEAVRPHWERAHPLSYYESLGAWPPGDVAGLELPNARGTRGQRAARRNPGQGGWGFGRALREQPQLRSPEPTGALHGPRQWWAPGWLELPLPRLQPIDAWYFAPRPDWYVPEVWYVPWWPRAGDTWATRWPTRGTRGASDPTSVFMVWVDETGAVRCPAKKAPLARFVAPSDGPRYLHYNTRLGPGVLALRGA